MQKFEFKELGLDGIKYIKYQMVADDRGENVKCYSRDVFLDEKLDFVPSETLLIHSKKGVLRGLHFQKEKAQSRLIQCFSGKIYAVVVDSRSDSKTLGEWITKELTEERCDGLFVPAGFALGTLALDESVLCCQCDGKFYSEYADGIRWNDSTLKISWPIDRLDGSPILSLRDQKLPAFQSRLKEIGLK